MADSRNETFLEVNGVEMPCPSSSTWGLQDVSAAESGRTEDAIMHKNRVAQKRKLTLQWNGPTRDECAKILKAFNPEYVKVRYWDLMNGTYETRTFYVGDRTAPYKCWWYGNRRMESLSFDIIEQ